MHITRTQLTAVTSFHLLVLCDKKQRSDTCIFALKSLSLTHQQRKGTALKKKKKHPTLFKQESPPPPPPPTNPKRRYLWSIKTICSGLENRLRQEAAATFWARSSAGWVEQRPWARGRVPMRNGRVGRRAVRGGEGGWRGAEGGRRVGSCCVGSGGPARVWHPLASGNTWGPKAGRWKEGEGVQCDGIVVMMAFR